MLAGLLVFSELVFVSIVSSRLGLPGIFDGEKEPERTGILGRSQLCLLIDSDVSGTEEEFGVFELFS